MRLVGGDDAANRCTLSSRSGSSSSQGTPLAARRGDLAARRGSRRRESASRAHARIRAPRRREQCLGHAAEFRQREGQQRGLAEVVGAVVSEQVEEIVDEDAAVADPSRSGSSRGMPSSCSQRAARGAVARAGAGSSDCARGRRARRGRGSLPAAAPARRDRRRREQRRSLREQRPSLRARGDALEAGARSRWSRART